MANYKDYMLFDKLPHTWCAGCGHGIILQAIADALAMQNLDKHDIALVSGIGCFGRVDDYLDINCMHVTHGRALAAATGVEQVYNYYGMAEQTGCIYMECPCGHLHASVWSDVVVRRSGDFSLCEPGEEGVLQVLSLLPRSYPGHSLLTEDLGVLLGEDDCPCGRLGKYFRVTGRVPRAEVRGCSDTYEG